MSEFLRMGGYGLYVWGAYGAALVVLALNLAAPIVRRRRLVRRLRAATLSERPARPVPPPP